MAAQRRAATSRRFVVQEVALRMSGGKGVIEIAIKCPAGQDEIPALGPIQEIVFSAEACLIFADGNVPVVIQCDGIWRHTVMEVKEPLNKR